MTRWSDGPRNGGGYHECLLFHIGETIERRGYKCSWCCRHIHTVCGFMRLYAIIHIVLRGMVFVWTWWIISWSNKRSPCITISRSSCTRNSWLIYHCECKFIFIIWIRKIDRSVSLISLHDQLLQDKIFGCRMNWALAVQMFCSVVKEGPQLILITYSVDCFLLLFDDAGPKWIESVQRQCSLKLLLLLLLLQKVLAILLVVHLITTEQLV